MTPFHGVRLVDGGLVPLKQLPLVASNYVSRLGVCTQAEYAAQHAMESVYGSPVRSGRFRGSIYSSVGVERFRGSRPGGQAFPVVTRAELDAILSQLDGKKSAFTTIDAYDYALIPDRGRFPYVTRRGMGGSLQAPMGVTGPAAIRALMATKAARVRIERKAQS